ncbi:hypothetical protein KI387_025805, partial [Taxus chinensis]
SAPTVVVSSPDMAKEFLSKYDLVFANMPASVPSKYVAYDEKNVGLALYGDYWRNQEIVCHGIAECEKKLPYISVMGELGQEDHESVSPQQQTGVILPVTENHVKKAVEALRAGKVIVVPTYTLYGLACDA